MDTPICENAEYFSEKHAFYSFLLIELSKIFEDQILTLFPKWHPKIGFSLTSVGICVSF